MNPSTLRSLSPFPRTVISRESSVPPQSGVRGMPEERAGSLPPSPVCARRVMLIDDEGPARDALVEVLRLEGYAVCAMTLTDAAFDVIHRAGPDLVLLSIRREDERGLTLCRELRRLDPRHLISILLLATGGCDEESVVAGLTSGADDYLVAPRRVAELKARLRLQLRNLRDRELLCWAREQRSSFRNEAFTDALTRLPNRRAIDQALVTALQGDQPTTVMLLDIDHFKVINDTWGHAVGDEVLRSVGATLSLCTRREDVVGRFGGEEFMVVLRGSPGDHADVLGDRYRQTIGAIEFPDDLGPARITVSVGIAQWDGLSERPTPAQLLELADEALYEAKRAGRDRVRVSELRGQGERLARPSSIEPEYPARTGTH